MKIVVKGTTIEIKERKEAKKIVGAEEQKGSTKEKNKQRKQKNKEDRKIGKENKEITLQTRNKQSRNIAKRKQ